MSARFNGFAGLLSMLAAVCGLLYAVAFVVLQNPLLYSLMLLLVGVLSTAPLSALYERTHSAGGSFARWAYTLALAGALGSAIHGGYDLANAINPPAANAAALADLPSQIDPRGLLTFGVGGLGLLVLAWLMPLAGFSSGLAYVGMGAAALNLVLYFGRLIVLNAGSPLILAPAALNGFIVSPLFYLWLGLTLRREPSA